MKHPRQMTLAELLELKVVDHIFGRPAAFFKDEDGQAWNVAIAGGRWIRAPRAVADPGAAQDRA